MYSADARTIVLMDDSFIIRELLKSELEKLEKAIGVNFRVFSTDNGVEGLGYIYALDPDLIIIDTTLPKYSGREVFEFLHSNPKFSGQPERVIILHQTAIPAELAEQFTGYNKCQSDFLQKLLQHIAALPTAVPAGFTFKLAARMINIANLGDSLLWKVAGKSKLIRLPAAIPWLGIQILQGILYTIYRSLNRRVPEESLEQESKDLASYRVRYYPTMVLFFSSLFLFMIYLVGFVASGIFIFGFRLDPAFALRSEKARLEFTSGEADEYEFATDRIEFGEDGVSLKPLEKEPIPDREPDTDVNPNPSDPEQPDDSGSDPDDSGDSDGDDTPESYPQTLGAEDGIDEIAGNIPVDNESGQPQNSEAIVRYDTTGPAVMTKEAVFYSELNQIVELSNENDDKSSSVAPESYEDKEPGTVIVYQLSPDKENWYYWSSEESRWARTELEWHSANTIQEINSKLEDYVTEFNSGKLFLKIFLVSNKGDETPILKEVVVKRENAPVTDVIDSLPEEPTIEEVELANIDFAETEVMIFNASYFEGHKIVKGKLLHKDKDKKVNFDLSTAEIAKLEASVYYTAGDNATKSEFIGKTNLYKNSRGELEFLVKAPSRAGGFVTAVISNGGEQNPDTTRSALAKPVENSTFTVDSTGDGADASLDGLCADGGGACTLRAAIQEANNVGGSDNIHFNIATSDPGYRDYDLPNTASSGDSLNGDDYWSIAVNSLLPDITSELHILGGTQTTNQSNTNTDGPEIQLSGQSGSFSNGFNFVAGSNLSTVDSLVINRFTSANINIAVVTDFELTRSYIGLDIKGLQGFTGQSRGIVAINGADEIRIGNTTADGNIIAGHSATSIALSCGLSGQKDIYVKGNKLGINRVDNVPAIAQLEAISIANDCFVRIGGTAAERNIISGTTDRAVYLNTSGAIFPDSYLGIDMRNNFLGTDTTGIQNRKNRIDLWFEINTGGAVYHNVSLVGQPGQGNLFRYSDIHAVRNRNEVLPIEFNSNTFADITNNFAVWSGRPVANTNQDVYFYNNYFGQSVNDPHFGLTTGPNLSGIWISSGIETIQGNQFVNNTDTAILVKPAGGWSNIRNNANWGIPRPTIGGTGNLSGSLCQNLEANCISGNQNYGIYQIDGLAYNEASLFADNKFPQTNGYQGKGNIEVLWYGLFEITTGGQRRTDITAQLTFPTNTLVRENSSSSSVVSTGNTAILNCVNGGNTDCPSAGHTTGSVDQSAFIAPTGATLSSLQTWYQLTEYRYLQDGTKETFATFKFDLPHLASSSFTFDGNSLTDPISSASARTIDGQNYLDRGEPWTNKPTANRDIPTGEYGRFQIMEVEYVDANPILQGDGSYVITVDSTSTEDNVSTTGYDDGTGNYSGGGMSGPDGLSNGKTSLREAILVANRHAGTDKIEFNIPTTDPGWNTPQFPNAFRILSPSIIYDIRDGGDVIIDGNSQTTFTGDTVTVISEPNAMPAAGNATTGPEVVIDFDNTVGQIRLHPSFCVNCELTIDRIGITGSTNNLRSIAAVVASQKVTIRNSTFQSNPRAVFEGSAQLDVQDNVFKNNSNLHNETFVIIEPSSALFEDNQFISNGGVNIQIHNSTQAPAIQIRRNLFKNNATVFTTDPAILLQGTQVGSNQTLIEENILNTGPREAITVDGSRSATIRENVIVNFGITGINNNAGTEDSFEVTANDLGDGDVGPSSLMNWPVIQSVKALGGNQYELKGDLEYAGSEGPITLEVCVADGNASGHGGCSESVQLFSVNARAWSRTITTTIPNPQFSVLATNNAGSTSEFGQYADANPVLQNDGSYVITVNSSSDENNVGTTFYADGDAGTASGGGLAGPSGIANGKTSLREAIIVANNHPGPDKIHFNIATTDANWNTGTFPNAFVINLTGILPDITDSGTTIDGTTQAAFTGNTNIAVSEPTAMPLVGNATTGPEIILNGQTVNSGILNIYGSDINIQLLGFYNINQAISGNRRVIQSMAAGSNHTINLCTFVNNGGGIYTARALMDNVNFTNNVIRETKDGGRDALELQFATINNLTIEGNQFVNNNAAGIYMAFQGSGAGAEIRNNLFKANSSNTTESKSQLYTTGNIDYPLLIENNTIIGGPGAGVMIKGTTVNATIRENVILDNVGLPIDIATNDNNQVNPGDGVTGNDVGDADIGPNDVQNFPVITKIEYYQATGKYRVYGDLDENSSENPWIIEICEAEGHTSGHGGCIQSLGYAVANSPWVTDVEISGSNGTDGRIFSALATNDNGSTSEFSANFDAIISNSDYTIIPIPTIPPVIPPPPPVGDTNDNDDGEDENEDDGETDAPVNQPVDDFGPTPVPTSGGVASEDPDSTLAVGEDAWKISVGILFGAVLLATIIAFVLGPLSELLSRVGVIIGVFIPKKRRYWGIVYDIEESKVAPFVAVELDDRAGNLVERTISDLQGKYALKAKAGEYLLVAKAPGYRLYTKTLSLRGDGEIIEDIALEKLSGSLKGSLRSFIFYRKQEILLLGRSLYSLLVMLGFLFTVYTCIVSPILINFLILAMYILMGILLLRRYLKTKSYGGRVVDSVDNTGLANSVVRFYRGENLEDIALSNASGDIKANLKRGEITVYAQKVGYQDHKDSVFLSDSGNLDRDISMQKAVATSANIGDNKFQMT